MTPLDRDIERTQALVIDGNPTSRSIVSAQLRDLGIGNVVQAPRLSEGRRRLEAQRFDIVVCEQTFPGEPQTGQELLDDLRRANLLPYATVFVMVTGEARYEAVAEAAESALDCYLLKPYAASTLTERLRQARHRKRVLWQIFAAIEADHFELAAQLCLDRFQQRGDYWLYAARLGAELLLRLGRHAMAGQVYAAVVAARPVPWARLGMARAQADAGQLGPAHKALKELLASEPDYTDAWDVLGRVQVEQGKFEEALVTYRHAAAATPGSIPRVQKQGLMAHYLGHAEEADQMLDRAALLGISSKMFDAQTLVALAFSRFHLKDAKGLQRCRENLQHLAARDPASARLQRFAHVVQALDLLLGQKMPEARAQIQILADERLEPHLDIEAGCNLLGLLAEWAAQLGAATPAEVDDWVSTLAVRYSTSRSVQELLVRSAARCPGHVALVHAAHSRVLALSESAMSHALQGQPSATVRELLDHAATTRNAKLLDTAALSLQRYRDKVPDAATLDTDIGALRQRYAASWAPPRLGQGPRAAGGLTLRESVAPASGSSPPGGPNGATASGAPAAAATAPSPL